MKGKIKNKEGRDKLFPLYGDAIEPIFMFVDFLATDDQIEKQKHKTTKGTLNETSTIIVT